MKTLQLVGGLAACTTISALIFFALFFFGPASHDAVDVDAAQLVVVKAHLADRDESGPVFVGFEGRDPFPEELRILVSARPALRIEALSSRPTSDRELLRTQQRDNFFKIWSVVFPVARMALVKWTTVGCTGDDLLLKISGRWRRLPSRWVCS